MENNYYVYGIFNTIKEGEFIYGKNDEIVFKYEPVYIGKGIKNRMEQSIKETHKNNFKKGIIKRYKKYIIGEKLKINLKEKVAYEYEIYLIKNIGKMIDKSGPLTNIADGGGEHYQGIEVLQYDIKGKFIQEYPSVYEAEVQTNTFNISSCCKGKRITSNNFIWRYKKNNYPKNIDVSHLNSMVHRGNKERSVLQYDMDMGFIKEYSSITEAQNKSGCHKSKIVAVCKGYRNHTKRFIWKYKQESLY